MFRKRVMWHLPYAMIGGVETLYKTIIKHIDHKNYDHHVTCHTAIEGWVRSNYPRTTTIETFSDPASLAGAIMAIGPDIIIGTHGMTLYAALDMVGGRACPLVEVVHGSHIWSEHNANMPKNYTKHVVCVSKSAERVYLENTDFDIPTSIILNGIDTDVFYPRKEFQTTARNFAYFGRFLESDKHITKIISAFRSLGTQHAKLYLIGGSSHEIASLKSFAKKNKLENAVKFFAHTSTPEDFYKDIDIVTVRSEAEGYCNVVGEAMASGVPTVCYNFGGILDHLPKGATLVSNSQQEYALHLSKIFRDADLRKNMIELGHKFIKTKGSASIMVKKYEDLIDSLINRKVVPVRRKPKTVEIPYVGKVTVHDNNPIVGVANPHWKGIYTSTTACCDAVVDWHSDPRVLMKNIMRHKPRHILFSGGCPGFVDTAKKIRNKYPNIPMSWFYHGGASHFSFDSGIFGRGERQALDQMVRSCDDGLFERIATASPGLAEVMNAVGIKATFTGNLVKRADSRAKFVPTDTLNIGNFNRHLDHKHTSIGLAAAMLVPNAKIHTLECKHRLPFIDYKVVQFYKEMPQADLYRLYQKMDVCLQLSFIETFNISVLEMWAHGVPVVLGPGNYIFCNDNPDLKSLCYVNDHTNPVEVMRKIRLCADHRERVVQYQDIELNKLNKQVTKRWEDFFA